MTPHPGLQRRLSRNSRRMVLALAILAMVPGAESFAQPARIERLRIGTTGTLTGDAESPKEKSARETLHQFIKDETGLENEVHRMKDWQELADKLAKGDLQLGVYQGYEFAWASAKQPKLKPLALGINVHRYPVAHVLAPSKSPATDFAGLEGQ